MATLIVVFSRPLPPPRSDEESLQAVSDTAVSRSATAAAKRARYWFIGLYSAEAIGDVRGTRTPAIYLKRSRIAGGSRRPEQVFTHVGAGLVDSGLHGALGNAEKTP